MNEIIVSERVVKSLEATGFNRNDIENYKNLYCKGASDDELIMFMRVCKATDLSPEKRQIYCVPRYDSKLKKNVYTPQTSVDGLRSVAERSGKYEGQTEAKWCGKDGVWKDLWIPTDKEPSPFAAKVGVFKEKCREAIFGVARWDAYVQKYFKDNKMHIGPMWQKMGDTMLAKCAESLALRKAFPNDTHGLYTKEEMEQAETGERDVTNDGASVGTASAQPGPFVTDREAALNAKLAGAQTAPRPVVDVGNNKPQPAANQQPRTDVKNEPATGTEPGTFDKFKAKKDAERANAKEKQNLKPVEKPVPRAEKPAVEMEAPQAHLGDEVPQELPNDMPPFDDFIDAEETQAPQGAHWKFQAKAGKFTGKTMAEIAKEIGKEGMIKMHSQSIKKISEMGEQGKEVPKTVLDTLKAMELCVEEMP